MRSDSTYVPITASTQTELNWITGWNFTENGGPAAAARVLLRDGGPAGAILADIRLSPLQSVGTEYDFPIDLVANDLYVDVSAGDVRGAVYGR